MDIDANELIGSAGVALLLLAFVLNTTGVLTAKHPVYTSMNFVGAGLACYASWLIDFLPFVVLEGAWCMAALWTFYRALKAGAADIPTI